MVPLRLCKSGFVWISYLRRDRSSPRLLVQPLHVRLHLLRLFFALRPDGAFVLCRRRARRGVVRCKKHLQQFFHGDFRRVEPYFQRFRVPVAGADRPVRDCFLSFFRGVFDSSSSTTRLLFFFFFRAGVADGDRRDPRNGCKRFRGSPKSSQSEPQLLVLPSHRRVARRFESLGSARRFGRPRTDCNASPSRQLKRQRRRGRGRKRRRRRGGRRDDETT